MNRHPILPRIPGMTRAALTACLALGLAACGGGAKDPAAAGEAKQAEAAKREEPQVPVEIVVAERRGITSAYASTAALEPRGEAQVVAKTSGVLLKLMVEEGDRVKAGQVLARLDPERPRLEVQRAQAMLAKLESEYQRAKELFERKLLAADAHERLRFDLDTQRAAYQMARLELSYTDVVAPIDGIIAQRMVKEGNLIQNAQSMFRIVDTDPLEAVLNVPERELAILRPGLPVSLSVDSEPGRQFAGTIARVSPVIDPGSGTFRVTCEFRDPSGALKPGMFGRISVVYAERADALTVTREALIEGDGAVSVFVVREGKARRQPVKLGLLNGGLVEILEGVEEGEQVVTTGKVTLRDGVKVQVLNAEPSAAIAQGGTSSQQSAAP
jgi:membrane fusion protein, multidrug efflux system